MKKFFIAILIFTVSMAYSKPMNMIFKEQIFGLYENNLYSTQTDHKRNIFWLENALKLPNIHPSQAIIITKTWPEYVKYKMLLNFNIYYLLTKEYVGWGWDFDKQDVVFYNMEWANKIKESFTIAKSRYETAKVYWEETKKWSHLAYQQNLEIGWGQIEDLNYEIENGVYDYDYAMVIQNRLDGLNDKIKKIDDYIAQNSKK
jgi:hypothetical protein